MYKSYSKVKLCMLMIEFYIHTDIQTYCFTAKMIITTMWHVGKAGNKAETGVITLCGPSFQLMLCSWDDHKVRLSSAGPTHIIRTPTPVCT